MKVKGGGAAVQIKLRWRGCSADKLEVEGL